MEYVLVHLKKPPALPVVMSYWLCSKTDGGSLREKTEARLLRSYLAAKRKSQWERLLELGVGEPWGLICRGSRLEIPGRKATNGVRAVAGIQYLLGAP